MRLFLTVTFIGVLCLTLVLAAAPADSMVADSAMRGDIASVRTLLKQGADVNAARADGMSALHWAAERGDLEMTDMLLYAGANPKAVTRIGHYTPLHVASRAGHAGVVERLLKSGAEVNAKTTNSGSTPLHLAAASGNAATISILADNGADLNARESEWEQTPLIFAAAFNRVEAIKALLEKGADPDLASKVLNLQEDGRLASAANNRQRQILSSLGLKEGQNPGAAQVNAAVLAGRELYLSGVVPEGMEEGGRGGRGGGGNNNNDDDRPPSIATKGGLTPLLHAARQGYVEAGVALLDGGANINLVSPGDQTSPLLMAVINAQFDMATMLVQRGADPNLTAFNGVAPLWAAVNAEWQPRTRFPQPQEHGLQKATYLDAMEALLKAGADPNARTLQHPWYMVYTGCGNGNCGLENTTGSTAFWRAAYATDVPAMRLLVQYGADPNITLPAPEPRARRQTAEDNPDSPVLKAVQPVGAGLWPTTDPATLLPDPSGLPPVAEGGPHVHALHAAAGTGYGEGFAGNAHRHAPDAWLSAVKYLVEELKVDVNVRDADGFTALHHAAARGDNEMIMYLVSKGADVTAVARNGQTTADMANGPVQRVSPFPETVELLMSLGSKNSNKCVTC
jgi:ankyrin repeat protein